MRMGKNMPSRFKGGRAVLEPQAQCSIVIVIMWSFSSKNDA